MPISDFKYSYMKHRFIEMYTCLIKSQCEAADQQNNSFSLRQHMFIHLIYLFNCMVEWSSLLILFKLK